MRGLACAAACAAVVAVLLTWMPAADAQSPASPSATSQTPKSQLTVSQPPTSQSPTPQSPASQSPASQALSPPTLLAQSATPIPYRKDDDAAGLALKVGIGLIVSIGIGVGVLLVLRRYLTQIQRAPGKRLRVLESVRLTPKSTLFLVEVDRRTLLIGQQGETLAVLAEPEAPRPEAAPASDAPPTHA